MKTTIWLTLSKACCAAAIVLLCSGCEPEDSREQKQPTNAAAAPDQSFAAPTGDQLVYGSNGKPDLAQELGNRPLGGGSGTYGQNLPKKGDTFSKLVYAYNGLATGRASRETTLALDAARRSLDDLGADDSVSALRQLADKLQVVVDSHTVEDRLRARRFKLEGIPWATGAISVDDTLMKMRQSRTSLDLPGTQSVPSPSDRETIELARKWATAHHESPALVRQETLAQADDLMESLYVALNEERKSAGTFTIERQGWNLRPNASNDPYSTPAVGSGVGPGSP